RDRARRRTARRVGPAPGGAHSGRAAVAQPLLPRARSEPGDALFAVALGLLVEALVLEQVQDRYAEPPPRLRGPVEVEELRHAVPPGEDDRLAPVDLADLRGERVDRRVGHHLAGRDRAAGAQVLE